MSSNRERVARQIVRELSEWDWAANDGDLDIRLGGDGDLGEGLVWGIVACWDRILALLAPQQDVDPFDLTSHSDEMCVCGKTHKECDEATPPP